MTRGGAGLRLGRCRTADSGTCAGPWIASPLSDKARRSNGTASVKTQPDTETDLHAIHRESAVSDDDDSPPCRLGGGENCLSEVLEWMIG